MAAPAEAKALPTLLSSSKPADADALMKAIKERPVLKSKLQERRPHFKAQLARLPVTRAELKPFEELSEVHDPENLRRRLQVEAIDWGPPPKNADGRYY
mmetsp:Transcript_89700/g.159389  ORF Transcript_89700/g.159389 Transcript_89700/m.159389 type:complete len:99 (-) Transcript_89700:151-447(-)